MAGVPVSNINAIKFKLWSDTLILAIAQDQGDRFRQAAERLLDKPEKDEQRKSKELIDRPDDKSVQFNTLESNVENQVAETIVNWVSPKTVLTLDAE